MTVSRSVRVAVSAAALVLGAGTANAQQILTALNTDLDDDNIDLVSTTAGEQISYSYQGNHNRAVTDYGVNKIYANASGSVEQSTTSAWTDTFKADGAAGTMVTMTFTFNIDGSAAFGSYPSQDYVPNYNFKVYALRGTGWTMYGYGGGGEGNSFMATSAGDDYDTLHFQKVTPGNVVQVRMLDESGAAYNFANANGEAGAFASQAIYDAAQDVYKLTTINQFGQQATGYFYDTYYRVGTPAGPTSPNIPYAANPALANARAGFEANFSILDFAQLCSADAGTCIDTTYEPTPVTVSFDVLAGTEFTIGAWLYSDGVTDATIDFFNTARLSKVTALDEAGMEVAVTSTGSGKLQALPGGGFGYPVPVAGVPEPAAWAMMIGGFGLVGGAMRRRRSGNAVLA